MNYTIEILDEPSVLLIRILQDFSRADFESHIRDVRNVFASLETPIYQIIDVRAVNLGLDDVMAFVKLSVRSEESITTHPMNRGNIIITENRFYQMVVTGIARASFGSVRIEVFESLDAALDWVHVQAE